MGLRNSPVAVKCGNKSRCFPLMKYRTKNAINDTELPSHCTNRYCSFVHYALHYPTSSKGTLLKLLNYTTFYPISATDQGSELHFGEFNDTRHC